jgi:uncharacterized protein YycO
MQLIINKILKLLKPVQIILQRIGRSEPKMNRQSVDQAMDLIRHGDILLSYESQRITAFFIKGEYDHVGIYTPKGVIDAVGDKILSGKNIGGVRSTDLEEWLFNMDKVAIIRPLKTTLEENYFASTNSIGYIGKGYDYQFKIDKNKIYCSELIYLSYKEFGIFNKIKSDKILPQVFRDLCDDVNFKLIYEFK